MAMLTAVARMFRTEMKHQMLTAGAKRIFKRVANRSERYASISLAEYGSDADDAMMENMAEEFSDSERCSYCRKSAPAHRMFWVKQFEWGACDCCESFTWMPMCTSCCTPPGLTY
jgi:hypothetical protein